jgi:ABC-2 type transport system permease protein
MDSLPVNFSAISLQAGEEHGDKVFDAHYGSLGSRFRAQEQLAAAVGLAAPLLSVRSLSMALAGTDREQHADFARSAEEYRRQLVEIMNASILSREATTGDAALWASVPAFVYAPPSLSAVLRQQWLAILVLLAWLGATSLVTVRSAARLAPEETR